MAARRVLVLGGTAEAAEAARLLDADAGFAPVVSLAGATRNPRPTAGAARTGGFGGAAGLAAYLRRARVDLLLDATHPYAARIARHAAEAGAAAGVPTVHLHRPPWRPAPGDDWREAADEAGAARLLRDSDLPDGAAVLLAIGRKGLAPFAAAARLRLVARSIEPPEDAPFLAESVLARGPFARDGEIAFLRARAIRLVVAKNSGGTASRAKIDAARTLGVPVVLLRRPPPPDGEVVATAAEAVARLRALAG